MTETTDPTPEREEPYVTRAGVKLAHALREFGIDPAGLVVADLGSHQGGFVDCLLRHGARRVYSVDTCYGTLAWKLRHDERVVVLERHNALHLELDGRIDGVTIDVGWTKQEKILPVAHRLVGDGFVVSLLKPQYEALPGEVRKGVVRDGAEEAILGRVLDWIRGAGLPLRGWVRSPIRGGKGNPEFLIHLDGRTPDDDVAAPPPKVADDTDDGGRAAP